MKRINYIVTAYLISTIILFSSFATGVVGVKVILSKEPSGLTQMKFDVPKSTTHLELKVYAMEAGQTVRSVTTGRTIWVADISNKNICEFPLPINNIQTPKSFLLVFKENNKDSLTGYFKITVTKEIREKRKLGNVEVLVENIK